MRRRLVGVVLGVVSLAAPLLPSPISGELALAQADACPAGVTQVLTTPDSSAPGGVRSVWVHRPPGPDSATIPVVYFLHGLPGSSNDAQAASFAAIVDHEACLGHRPVVIAAPDGNVVGGGDTEWGDDAHGHFALETFVTTTLISMVEGADVRPVADRALVGFSMGGFAAVAIGLRHRIYARVVSLAGYYVIDDPDHVFGSRAVFHDPAHLLARGHGLPMLLEDATGDSDGLTAGSAVRFAPLLRARGLPVTVRVRAGRHSLSFVSQELPGVLRWLDGGWPRPR